MQKEQKEINRKQFLEVFAIAATGLAIGGLAGYLEVKRERNSVSSFLDSDFGTFLDTVYKKNGTAADAIFYYLPQVLKREKIGNQELLDALVKTRSEKPVVEIVTPFVLDSKEKSLYESLKFEGWERIVVPSLQENESSFSLKLFLCQDPGKLRDVLPLSLSQADIKIYQKGKNSYSTFQNQVLSELFGYKPVVLGIYGFAIVPLSTEEESSFFGFNMLVGETFAEWFMSPHMDLDSKIVVSDTKNSSVFIFEDLCKRVGFTYRQVIDLFGNSDIEGFAKRVLESITNGKRVFSKEELGVGFLNLSSFVEESAPELAKEEKSNWEGLWQKGIERFASNMLPVLPTLQNEDGTNL